MPPRETPLLPINAYITAQFTVYTYNKCIKCRYMVVFLYTLNVRCPAPQSEFCILYIFLLTIPDQIFEIHAVLPIYLENSKFIFIHCDPFK